MTDHQDDEKSPRSALGGLLALQSAIVAAEHRREQAEAAKAEEEEARQRDAEQEARIQRLEKVAHSLAKANADKAATIKDLKKQVLALQTHVQRLQASRTVPVQKTPRRDELDAALERELIGE
ncbi:MAG: hypothetical protein WC048_04230 [Rhizobium sp.]